MAQQHINLGTPPSGVDGDTDRGAWEKAEGNFNELYAASGGVVGVAGGAFKNLLVNGDLRLWQPATSIPSATGLRYTANNWKSLSTGTQTAASQQAFIPGQTTVPGNPRFFHRSVVTSVAGAANYAALCQYVEDVTRTAGQAITVSFWAKADAAKKIGVNVVQVFGAGGSANVEATSQAVNVTTAWQQFKLVFVMPSIAGKVLGTGGDDRNTLNWFFDAGANFNTSAAGIGQQSGTFDLAMLQMELGTVATAFEARPLATELMLTGRTYQMGVLSWQYAMAAIGQFVSYPFTVPMRLPPTMRVIDFTDNDNSGAGSIVTLYADLTGIYRVDFASAPTKTAARYFAHWAADAG